MNNSVQGTLGVGGMSETRPYIFVGSSSEGAEFARAIRASLERDAEVTVWDEGVFALGQTFIESLITALFRFDFAILILTADDLIQSRSTETFGPRDNVIFELGLFMGKLGRDRTFIVHQSALNVKIPSDLSGLATAQYYWPRQDNNYRAAVSTACDRIRDQIRSLGALASTNTDPSRLGSDGATVKVAEDVIWSTAGGCEIRVANGRVEDYPTDSSTVMVLPCNEYFDDRCAYDTKSALGAYVNKVFDGQVDDFISLSLAECRRKLGQGEIRQKTADEQAVSFGPGRCVLLLKPLNHSTPVALVSTTTQRAGQGLVARTSYLFEGICELVTRLADARLNEIVMPILGAGHGRMDPALGLISLLLAVAEAARYAPGGRPLRRVTIIVYRRDLSSPPGLTRLWSAVPYPLLGRQPICHPRVERDVQIPDK